MRLKDKNRPKSPLSGFACFVQVIRAKHSSIHPNDNVIFSEFAKRCAERWREMPIDKRASFEEMSRLDAKRYNREMGEYVQQQLPSQPLIHTQQQQSQSGSQKSNFKAHHHYMRGAKRRRFKDPLMPKRSLSAFFFFCDHYRPKIRSSHPEWRVSEIAKELGRLWDECTDKVPYELKAQNDKLRYEEEMRRYKEGTFIVPGKRLRDVSGPSGSGAMKEDGGVDDNATGGNVANSFEIEGSREADEMDGKTAEDDIDDEEEDADEYEEDEEEEEEEELEDDEREQEEEKNERAKPLMRATEKMEEDDNVIHPTVVIGSAHRGESGVVQDDSGVQVQEDLNAIASSDDEDG